MLAREPSFVGIVKPSRDYRFLITCEHASAALPARWRRFLQAHWDACDEHERWDPGTLEIGAHLGDCLRAPVFNGEQTRLLVDLNRSMNGPGLFSPPIRELPREVRTGILVDYYHPFRRQVRRAIDSLATEGKPIVHLSVHSFTPVLQGVKRTVDFGLLFDPARPSERKLGALWLHHLQTARPDLICKPNDPYRGIDDGHTTAMRAAFGEDVYLGMELEFNQKLPLREAAALFASWMVEALERSLEAIR